jgi:hypothetical protein
MRQGPGALQREAQLFMSAGHGVVAAARLLAFKGATCGACRSPFRASHGRVLHRVRLTCMLTAWKITVAERAHR